jgi:hypothetical protein
MPTLGEIGRQSEFEAQESSRGVRGSLAASYVRFLIVSALLLLTAASLAGLGTAHLSYSVSPRAFVLTTTGEQVVPPSPALIWTRIAADRLLVAWVSQGPRGVDVVKGEKRITNLQRWIDRNPSASSDDTHTAETLLQDLISAMSGEPFPGR